MGAAREVPAAPGRRRRRIHVVPVVAVLALLGAGVIARSAIGEPPHPAAIARGSGLDGMACPTSVSCVAVGSMGSVYGVEVPYAVVSTGDAWTARPPQAPPQVGDTTLASVTCPSPASCLAVGRQELPTPFFGSRSSGDRPYSESWNGTEWLPRTGAFPPTAIDSSLTGVSCASSTCMAVGEFTTRATSKDLALAETWDGSKWTLALPPRLKFADDVVLMDVDCTSPTSCVAVGHLSYDELFNGAAPLVERWNGTTWSPERSRNPAGSADTELQAVDCVTAERCVAVGYRRMPDGTYAAFAEMSRGSAWTVLPTVSATGSPDTELADVSCPAADRCTAVGTAVLHGSVNAFAESWDGSTWTEERTPTPPGSTSSALSTVDCTPPADCRAAGVQWHGSPIGHALSEARNGAGWAILPVPESP
jgi:hypothetical protein